MSQNINTNIQFRNATIDDVKALLEIEVDCFTKYYKAHRFTEQQFTYYLRNPLAITLIATKDDHQVGYILGLTQRGRLKHIARIYSIAVLPSIRKTGIGQQLLTRFIRNAKKRGVRRVTLEVAEKNPGAMKLFVRCGFHETEHVPDYYGNGNSGVRMERKL